MGIGRELAWLVALAWVATTSRAEAASTFVGLGDLPGGGNSSVAHAISDDATTVVGVSQSGSGKEAFRWTTATGIVGLGDLPGGAFQSIAYDVSSDGLSIVGGSTSASGDEAFRWRPADGMVGLGSLQSSPFFSMAKGVAIAGGWFDRIAGTSLSTYYAPSPDGAETAFLWIETIDNPTPGYMAFAGYLSPGFQGPSYYAEDVSDTGVVVGIAHGPVSWQEAARWTSHGADVEFLGNLPGGSLFSQANSVSADGTLIVGFAHSPFHVEGGDREAFLWSEQDGMVGLGDLPGGRFSSEATAISADGTTVVGSGGTDLGEEAFVWDETNGMRSVMDVAAQLGLDLAGWTLTRATGVSGDGEAIVGYGTNPTGDTEAWLLVIDEPQPAPVPGFYRLGPGTAAYAVSGDGTTVVGTDAGDGASNVFRWRQTTGFERLGGDTYWGPFLVYPGWAARLIEVSEDGEVVVATAGILNQYRSYFWTSGVLLPAFDRTLDYEPSSLDAEVRAMSADGQIIAGFRNYSLLDGTRVFGSYIWSVDDGFMTVPVLPENGIGWMPRAMSADGAIVAGFGSVTEPPATCVFPPPTHTYVQPVLWDRTADSVVGLGVIDLGGGVCVYPSPIALSADGSTMVGYSEGYGGFRWTEATGFDTLDFTFSAAMAASGDGSVVVGFANEAMIWDAAHGPRPLADALASLGIDTAGLTLTSANDISDDGRVIVGEGLDGNGGAEGWVAVLPVPEPAVGPMAWASLLAVAALRRARRRG